MAYHKPWASRASRPCYFRLTLRREDRPHHHAPDRRRAQENTLLCCEGQHDRGHEVTLITGPPLGPEGSLLERAERLWLSRRSARRDAPLDPAGQGSGGRISQLVRRLREIEAGRRAHAQQQGGDHRAVGGAAGAGVPVDRPHDPRAGVHGLHLRGGERVSTDGLERATAPITTRIVCVADAMRDQSLAAHVGRPEQYVTVYSGMKTAPFLDPPVPREQVRRRLGLQDEHVAVGTIARLFDLKGHDDLLDSRPQLCRRFPNLRFLWVGDGLLRGAVRAADRGDGAAATGSS